MADLPLRHSCRALLIDGDSILLAQHRVDDYAVWAGPGGGVEPGETHLAALSRELHEETGLIITAEHTPQLVWIQTATMPWMRGQGLAGLVNHYFLIPVVAFEPASGVTPEAPGHPDSEGILTQRWWALEAIEAAHAAGELFSPRALPKLLRELLTDGPPTTPLALGL